MSLIKLQGVVLKNINLGESDKIITLYTDKFGKIDVVVHGARKTKSKFMASTQPFCYGEYVLYGGKNLYTLSQSSIIDSFQGLLMDLKSLSYGSYFLELIDNLNEKESKNVSMLALLLKTLYIMLNGEIDLDILRLTVEFKAISLSGYMPQIRACVKCNSKLINEGYFDIVNGGVRCIKCGNNFEYYRLNFEEIQFLHILKNIKLENLRDIKYDIKVLIFIQDIITKYIKYHTGRDFHSLNLISKLKD